CGRETGGALRRGGGPVDRLAAVVAASGAGPALDHAERYPAAAAVLERDAGRVLMRLPNGLNVEVHATAAAGFALEWNRRTGSEEHLAKLALLARAQGLGFDERGVRRAGQRLSLT